MTDDQILEVVQAHREGKKIQSSISEFSDGWYDAPLPTWSFKTHNYRIKPEPPKPREWWIRCDEKNPIIIDYEPVNSGYYHVREVLKEDK